MERINVVTFLFFKIVFLKKKKHGRVISFFQNDGRRESFFFSRKICKSAPVLISRTYLRVCRITLFALFDGTPEQLQICSFKRNDSLLPVCWKKDKYQDKDHKSICFCFGTWYNKFAYT